MDYVKLSKEISYALRHAPWDYELELDEEGFVPIDQLLDAINESKDYEREITKNDLTYIINNSEKKRHEIKGKMIRALYGHSVSIKIIKTPGIPPNELYHGTTHQALPFIKENGLLPMKRQYVHLSTTKDIAINVGKRRDDNPIILEIDAKTANAEGIIFYIGNENVWLCDSLPSKYIKNL